MAERLASHLDAQRFGVTALYLVGSVKRAAAGPWSDIDLLVVFAGTEVQRTQLLLWLEGWSLCLDELNCARTGHRTGGLLDVHLITAADIARQTSYAIKIGSPTDPARPLTMKQTGTPVRSSPDEPPPGDRDRNG